METSSMNRNERCYIQVGISVSEGIFFIALTPLHLEYIFYLHRHNMGRTTVEEGYPHMETYRL